MASSLNTSGPSGFGGAVLARVRMAPFTAGVAAGVVALPATLVGACVLFPRVRWVVWRYVLKRLSMTKERIKRHSRPKRIFLIRHGQSEGNVDDRVYARKPDNEICLTDMGVNQATELGKVLRGVIGDEVVRFYVSPFKRTVQTFQNIAKAFDETKYSVRIEPRLREQEWGNLQDHAKISEYKKERRIVGSFYYRFPDGESGADVYDRITTFMDSLFREFKRDRYEEQNLILVSHGITCRMFLMRFFRWTPDMFHSSINPQNCEYYLMDKQDDGSYRLTRPGQEAPFHIFPLQALEAGARDPYLALDPALKKICTTPHLLSPEMAAAERGMSAMSHLWGRITGAGSPMGGGEGCRCDGTVDESTAVCDGDVSMGPDPPRIGESAILGHIRLPSTNVLDGEPRLGRRGDLGDGVPRTIRYGERSVTPTET